MRCFVGIELSGDVRDASITAAESVRACDPTWAAEKWVAADNLHVTVRFLGTIDGDLIPPLINALAASCASAVPFELTPQPLTAVPSPSRAAMLWLPLADPTGDASLLAMSVGLAADPFTTESQQRPFAGHVTLVRSRRGRTIDRAMLSAASRSGGIDELRPMSVPSATLFASTLTARGPIYRILASWMLGGSTVVDERQTDRSE